MDNILSFCSNAAVISLDTIHIGGAILIGLLCQSHLARIGSSFALALLLTMTVAFLRVHDVFNESPIWLAMAFSGILVIAYLTYGIKWAATKAFHLEHQES